MESYLIDMLECPLCRHQLDWRITDGSDERIKQGEAECVDCGARYPVKDGIGIFLTPDLPRNDMWAEVEGQLTAYLREYPVLERQLMDGPVEELAPTDQHFRALVLDERGHFAEGKRIETLANQNLYTPEYMACWDSQIDYVLESLNSFDGPIVDLASGRCYLVEKIINQLRRPVIATDFSLSVLRRNRKYFQFLGLDEHISFLAFDARKTPFRDGAINVMTTNLGLPNIEGPGELLNELRRIVSGTFLAISHLFPMNDEPNGTLITQAGIEAFVYKESALDHFAASGWRVQLENRCVASALPTPESKLFDGARADGLPVAPTTLEWCVIRASG